MIDRSTIVARLREIAALLQAKGGNRYKVRAYTRGARALEASKMPLEELVEDGKLEDLPGIGAGLAGAIGELYRTGTTGLLEKLRAGEPLKIDTKSKPTKVRLYDGLLLAESLIQDLRAVRGVSNVVLTGPVAEAEELSPSLDLMITTDDPNAVIEHASFGAIEEANDEHCLLRLADGTRIDLHFGEAPVVGANPGLVTIDDIRGFTHCHSTWSDGKNTIEEMARAAAARGAKFITITDHSKNAFYAGGLDVDRLREQGDEIAEVQERLDEEGIGIRLLRGTEADILADGQIDFPDGILEQLDVVIASIHNRYKQDEEKMTQRVLRAMRWPGFKIWGHPLGRLVPSRPPIPLRVEEVLDAIAEAGNGAIEINGDPYRMDLEPKWAARARERGLKFVLSVDAHSTGNLDFLRTAVALARRAGIEEAEVLNARPPTAFLRAVKPRTDKPCYEPEEEDGTDRAQRPRRPRLHAS